MAVGDTSDLTVDADIGTGAAVDGADNPFAEGSRTSSDDRRAGPHDSLERAARRRPSSRRHRAGTALRLAAFHAIVLSIVLGVVVAALVHQFSMSYEALAANDLGVELRAFGAATAHLGANESLAAASVKYLRARSLPAGTELVIALPGSQMVATPGADLLRTDAQTAGWLEHPPRTSLARTMLIGGHDVELLVAPITSQGRTVGTWLATTDLSPLRAQRARVLALSLAEATVALLAGVMSSYFLLRRLLRTVGRITKTAEEIGGGELAHRLGDQGTDDEVGQLATTFDGMLDRVDSVLTAQRRLLSDVSHQLRTPMTVARGHLEVLQRTGGLGDREADATVALVLDELDHMRALVERLLLLGRAMEPDFLIRQPIDVRSFMADLFDAAQIIAPRLWSLAPVPDVVLQADPEKLRGAMLNLVDNAVHATTADDAIEFAASIEHQDRLVLSLEDSGPGIPPAQREAVLARFARPGARGEDGSGLGLAIVKAVAEAHGGVVEVGDSGLGGARVAIVLPLGGGSTQDGS
ncbi:MAG TPA: HAMP domain-containing sensor histidine kinase [Acidimicrobiales bacterium]|nr:HAMP domain-containing sensor histidine kinase [Acidimicrobiales bacterium]